MGGMDISSTQRFTGFNKALMLTLAARAKLSHGQQSGAWSSLNFASLEDVSCPGTAV